MVTVTFRADKVTLDAIDELEAGVEPGVKGRKAVAIRQGLQEAAQARRENNVERKR